MNKILYKLKDAKPSFWLMRYVPEYVEDNKFQNAIVSAIIDQRKANSLEIINPELLTKIVKSA